MAPRPSMVRRSIAPHGEHIYQFGVVGRKTGVTVPDSGVRDEHGMEPLDNLFSSPSKSDHDQEEEVSVESNSGDEAMDITATSGFGPQTLINGHPSRFPVPSAQNAKSPSKSLLNSPAQRNRLIRNPSSPARGSVVRDDDLPRSQPTISQNTTKRKLDFGSVANGGPHSLSQPARTDHYGTAKGLGGGNRLPSWQEDEEANGVDSEDDYAAVDEEVNNFIDESMAMLQDDGADEPQQGAEDEEPPAPAATKRPGRPPKQSSALAKSAATKSKPTKAAPEPEEEEEEDDDDDEDEDEDEEPAPQTQKAGPGRRGRPPKAAAPAPQQPAPRASKKRRSLDEEEASAAKEPASAPQSKRQRTENEKPVPKKPSAASRRAAEPDAGPAAPKARGRKAREAVDPDVSQVAVAPRPPLPKSRGLLINRREVPGDSGMLRTRSGRTSFRPLAFWRNERVEFEKDEAEDILAGRKHRGRFVLPSVKEVVRVEEPEPEPKYKSRRGGASKKRGKSRRRSSGYEEDDDDDGPVEAWELDPGTVTGEVVVWQPEYEYAPPAPNDLVSVMDKQLAISGAAIKTTEVVGGEFRYAKVFSEGFIGAGVVDLPPGAVKRLKNSRKVFMIFFVHVGRVLVTVQETSFRIGKGGIFIVPRYNEYTIQNDYDKGARIFFAQGQEVAAAPPPPEPAPAEGEDADEEVEVSEEEEGSGQE